MISAPFNARLQLGGIGAQRSEPISIPNVVLEVWKIRLEPKGAVWAQRWTVEPSMADGEENQRCSLKS